MEQVSAKSGKGKKGTRSNHLWTTKEEAKFVAYLVELAQMPTWKEDSNTFSVGFQA